MAKIGDFLVAIHTVPVFHLEVLAGAIRENAFQFDGAGQVPVA